MKKRIFAAVLASALLMLAACSGDTSDILPVPDSTGQTTSETPPEEIPAEEDSNLPSVEMSHKSGVYEQGFELTISAMLDGEILYTTDGSDPATSATAIKYTAPISIASRKGEKNVVSAVDTTLISGSFNEPNSEGNGFVCTKEVPTDDDVDKCTVVRAAVKRSDGTFGREVYSTYFIGTAEEHIRGLAESCEAAGTSLAVVSLSVNYDDFFSSDNGIYVKGDIFDKSLADYLTENKRVDDPETARRLDANYKQRGREWERTAAVSMIEMSPDSAEEVISQVCGVRIQGNYSRSDLQKGLRLYARSDYGEKNFNYAVFGEDYLDDSGNVMDKFKTLVLRAGGNCAFIAKFNDAYWQSLCRELDCETKRSRPCVLYLNGEYWGLYILEEDYDDAHFEQVHGVNKDEVVVYKGDAEALQLGYKLDEGTLPEGVTDETWYFKELLTFFDTHSDLKSDDDYAEFEKLVDVQSVMDYFAAEVWINNKWDWPGKNWSMWKTTATSGEGYADGRWRFMLYDMEFGGVSGADEAGTNTIKEDNYKKYGLLDMDTSNPAVLCFAYLMTNEGFRTAYCDKLTALSSTCFEENKANEVLNNYVDVYSPLYEQFFERYPDTGSADDAINGGYASAACIRDFLSKRPAKIPNLIKYVEKIRGGE